MIFYCIISPTKMTVKEINNAHKDNQEYTERVCYTGCSNTEQIHTSYALLLLLLQFIAEKTEIIHMKN